jgi:hypothetical protein
MSKTTATTPAETPASQSAAPGHKSPPKDFAARGCPYCAVPLRPGAKFCDNCGSPVRTASDPGPGMMAEAWISVGIGILLLILCPTMTKYLSSKVFHTHFAPYADKDHNPNASDSAIMTLDGEVTEVIPYTKTTPANDPNFGSDLSISTFALALIVEGIALVLSRQPAVVGFAILVTIAATLLNLIYVSRTLAGKYPFPLVSALAVIFGIYMALYQFRLLQTVLAQKTSLKKA